MAKKIYKNFSDKVSILNKIAEEKKSVPTSTALKNAGISDATYYKWRRQVKAKNISVLNIPKKRTKTEPQLVSFPMSDEHQPICVIFGPSDKVNSALSRLAEIYKQGS